ncbi:hypothetical protein PGTUg99_015658 [Puccinia graminis f. sp. tritici]|uniref:Uncharacterized protein n=1 Tax=Puccinia graminis f. sp. tritici TaxID=56615 RepID=A0A5B0SN14_PUCGR|nr:hypothetical protein PGTUg99_015658 [Puccinia graminis f. sp. tritici]
MKFTGIWFMPLLFHGLMAVNTHLDLSDFSKAASPFPSDNPTFQSVAYRKNDDYQRSTWSQLIYNDARQNTWSRDIEISISTHAVQNEPAANRIKVWNAGELEVEYCLKHLPSGRWTPVRKLEHRERVYLEPGIQQVELHLRQIRYRTTPRQPRS